MHFEVGAFCEQGRVRTTNEDVATIDGVQVPEQGYKGFRLPSRTDHLLLVADGMGGHAGGDIASALAADHISRLWRVARTQLYLPIALAQVNRAIYSAMDERPDLKGMGTTLAGVHLFEDYFRWFSVGDSRVYLLRNDELLQLSADHVTGDGDLYPAGLLTQSLGGQTKFTEIDPALGHERLQSDDTLLVCSDGVSGVLSQGQIARACRAQSILHVGLRLYTAIDDQGAPDNLAFIAIRPSGR
jgi:serine/threonine protein phosphatase PrpC